MKKIKEAVKRELKESYETMCNNYKDALLRLWELDWHYGYWNSDEPGTIYHYGEVHNLTMEEIIYIVENDIEEDEVLAWEDYTLDAYEFGFYTPNLQAWHMGCPRTSQEAFDKFRDLKDKLNDAVEAEKERIKKQNYEKDIYTLITPLLLRDCWSTNQSHSLRRFFEVYGRYRGSARHSGYKFQR